MKRLTLIRHAKSSWQDPSLADIERPLNSRGRRDAPMMGQFLAECGMQPDLLITSPAVRAQATARIIAEQVGYPLEEIVIDRTLYHADVFDWLRFLQGLDDGWDHVMCFGHNPEMTELVNELSPLDLDNLPTCGVVDLHFDTATWSDVGRIEAIEADFDYPKRHRG